MHELVALLQRCREIITALHFKGHVLTASIDVENDVAMFQRIQSVMRNLESDEENVVVDDDDDLDSGGGAHTTEVRGQAADDRPRHQTLKASVFMVAPGGTALSLWWNPSLICVVQ